MGPSMPGGSARQQSSWHNQETAMNNSSTGLSENVAGALCYSLLWISGLVFLIVERRSGFVRFHAMQSLIAFGVLSVAIVISSILPVIGGLINGLLGLLLLVLWVVMMVKAWQGERFKLPWAGDEAEKQVGRMVL
jgi:uncharacterized membrane protein